MRGSGIGRIRGAGGCPTVGAGIVSPASLPAKVTAPNDHFTAGPDRRMSSSGSGRVGEGGGCPTVGTGIVSPASVEIVSTNSAPNDHFAASPDRRVTVSGSGRVGGA